MGTSSTPLNRSRMPRTETNEAKAATNTRSIDSRAPNSSDHEEPEIWDMIRQLWSHPQWRCHTPGCAEPAIAVWASNKSTCEWYTCDNCQLKDFDGWPVDEVPWVTDCEASAAEISKPTALKRTVATSSRDSRKRTVEKQASITSKAMAGDLALSTSENNVNDGNGNKLADTSPGSSAIMPAQLAGIQNTIQKKASAKYGLPSGDVVSLPIENMVNNGHGMTLGETPNSVSPLLHTGSSDSCNQNVRKESFKSPLPGRQHVPRAVTPPSPSMAMRYKVERTLATIRYWKADQEKKGFTEKEILYAIHRRSTVRFGRDPLVYKLRRGGTLKIYPNLVHSTETSRIQQELFQCGLFRQYQVQAQDEPRLHFLLHENATNGDFETTSQPGYRYANVRMKARPLERLPQLEQLSQRLASVSGVDGWTIGVNPVLYRDCNDKMGTHADDDQGEEVILCLIVSSPQEARRVIITPKEKKVNLEEDDETIELILEPGDAYSMDGEMQQYYVHSVPREKETKERSTRIAVVFRTGNEVKYARDSGKACNRLSPKPPKVQIFGNAIPGLVEGYVYPRFELFERCAHLMQQRGISGNLTTGADAIIVSGLREDRLGSDHFLQFMYAVESAKGGRSVVTSYEKRLPIRVFRSSVYKSPYRAQQPPRVDRKPHQTVYRYDGLYQVVSYLEPRLHKGPFEFYLHRIDAGSNEMFNRIRNSEFAINCCRLGTIVDMERREYFESAQLSTTRRIEQRITPKRNWHEAQGSPALVSNDNELPISRLVHQLKQASAPVPSIIHSKEKKKQKCSEPRSMTSCASSTVASKSTRVMNKTMHTLTAMVPFNRRHRKKNKMYTYKLSYKQAAARHKRDLQMAASRFNAVRK